MSEQDIFASEDYLAQMIRALVLVLALGNTYRSPQLKALMVAQKQASGNDLDAVTAPPCLTRREADVVTLLLEGHHDRQSRWLRHGL